MSLTAISVLTHNAAAKAQAFNGSKSGQNDRFFGQVAPPHTLKLPAKNLSGHLISQINKNTAGAKGSTGYKEDQANQPVLIAITGGFKGNGSDVTHKVAGNSTTEKLFGAAQQLAKDNGTQINGIYIAPGGSCDNSVKTAADFVAHHHQPNEKLIVYGYSNGGRCAVDVVTQLQKQGKPVDLLITVDATDRKNWMLGTNSTVDKSTPANVTVHHNFYQQDECGLLSCPQGEPHHAENPANTQVINHKTEAEKLTNSQHQSKAHRHMEIINWNPIINLFAETLKNPSDQ